MKYKEIDFKPLTLKEHGKQTWFSGRKPFKNDSVKDCLLRCVKALEKEIETGDFEALSAEQCAGIKVKLINAKAKTGGVK
jgi:uncharacterized protein (DUF2461 family)